METDIWRKCDNYGSFLECRSEMRARMKDIEGRMETNRNEDKERDVKIGKNAAEIGSVKAEVRNAVAEMAKGAAAAEVTVGKAMTKMIVVVGSIMTLFLSIYAIMEWFKN